MDFELNVDCYRGGGVLAGELAELPLTCEQPQRIADASGEALVYASNWNRLIVGDHSLSVESVVVGCGRSRASSGGRSVRVRARSWVRSRVCSTTAWMSSRRQPRCGFGGTARRIACGARAPGRSWW